MGHTTFPAGQPGGVDRDFADYERLRHARERAEGFPIGNYLQPPPMLFTRDGHNVFLGDMYRGHSAFLICGGPSLTSHDLTRLSGRGILTMAVNNAATVVRPNLWCSVDDPGNFADAIWYDPGITKFVPLCHMEKTFTVRNSAGELVPSAHKVGDMPAVFGFRRNEAFQAQQFLTEDTFNWGNHSDRVDSLGNKGSRSVMYVALRLLYHLGVRQIYLLGCDFQMKQGVNNYAFPQDRSDSSIRGNNDSYRILNSRLASLLPFFESARLSIHNCTPNSGLTVFPKIAFESAIEQAASQVPTTVDTSGMYDRQERLKASRRGSTSGQMDPEAVDTSAVVDSLPPLTVAVPVDEIGLQHLTHSWHSWVKLKPWMKRFPFLFFRHPRVSESDITKIVGPGTVARIETMPIDEAIPHSWERAKVVELPRRVETAWYWMLEPSAVATSPMDWIKPQLFEKDETGRPPAFIACQWGYTKPAGIYSLLDTWADRIPEFRDHPPLQWQPTPGIDRLNHGAISSWSFVADTCWAKSIADVVDHETPVTEHSVFMLFSAARQQHRYTRISMKRFGWDHSFGWNSQKTEERCRQALSPQ